MVALHATMTPTGPATFTLPASLDALASLSEWIQAVASAHGLSDRCTFRLELVLDEAVTNIIQHADAGDGDLAITVELWCAGERVLAKIEDTGQPFDPTTAPAHTQPQSLDDARIGGLGIHLIRSYTEDLEYRRVDQRNQLRMTVTCNA